MGKEELEEEVSFFLRANIRIMMKILRNQVINLLGQKNSWIIVATKRLDRLLLVRGNCRTDRAMPISMSMVCHVCVVPYLILMFFLFFLQLLCDNDFSVRLNFSSSR